MTAVPAGSGADTQPEATRMSFAGPTGQVPLSPGAGCCPIPQACCGSPGLPHPSGTDSARGTGTPWHSRPQGVTPARPELEQPEQGRGVLAKARRDEESPATTQLHCWRELERKGVMEAHLWLPTIPTAPGTKLRRGRRSTSRSEPRHLFIYIAVVALGAS